VSEGVVVFNDMKLNRQDNQFIQTTFHKLAFIL